MTHDDQLATLARAAARGRELTLGVLSDDVGNGYSAPIISEFWRLARQHGMRLIQFVERLEPEDVKGRRRLVTDLASKRCLDALLVSTIGPNLRGEDVAEYCERLRPLPMCCIPEVHEDWCSHVGVDNASGMREATLHLVEHHGYTDFAFVCGPENNDSAKIRFEVFKEVLEANGIDLQPRHVVQGTFLESDGFEAVDLLDDGTPLPKAIVCANDAMAFGVIQALTARGIRVPADVAVIGYDNIDLCPHMNPPLTTVRQPLREQGRMAFEIILKQLAGNDGSLRVQLPSVLTVRQSCGCAFAAPGNSNNPPATGASASATNRANDDAIEALRSLDIEWPERPGPEQDLVSTFSDDVAGGRNSFLSEMQQTLTVLQRANRDVAPLQMAVTVLWKYARTAYGDDPEAWRRADALLHGARLLVAGIAERTQSLRQVQSEGFANKLSATHGALSLTVDVSAVEDVLVTELPKYDISSCYVCTYEDPTNGSGSRLLAGVRASQRYRPLHPEASEFSAESVLPEGLLADRDMAECIIGPLRRAGHAPGYAVFAKGPEDGFVYENLLAQFGATLNRLELLGRLIQEAKRREVAERERLEKEMSIATRIQTGVLPRSVSIEGLEVAARMIPASEVGGDYYDVIQTTNGCWLGIGDVAGHGLPAGVVMLMLQSVLGGLCRMHPGASPANLLHFANQVLFDNVRQRMGQDEHITLSLLKYESSGRVVFAGAHEDLLIYRARSGSVDTIPTVGTWLAAAPEIEAVTENAEFTLAEGDVLLLHTDGVTESMATDGQRFGTQRLARCLADHGKEPVAAICRAITERVEHFGVGRVDDMTLLVARHVGAP